MIRRYIRRVIYRLIDPQIAEALSEEEKLPGGILGPNGSLRMMFSTLFATYGAYLVGSVPFAILDLDFTPFFRWLFFVSAMVGIYQLGALVFMFGDDHGRVAALKERLAQDRVNDN